MEERLNAISVEHPSHQTREPPQADTLARLLTQGLQSQDKKLLNVIICQFFILPRMIFRSSSKLTVFYFCYIFNIFL
jgi:hypothetical protein